MDLQLRGKRALVTGGSRGIGLQIARALLVEGAENLADELGRHGVNVTVVHPGATVTERTPQLVAAAAQNWGVDDREAADRLSANTAIGRSVTAAEVADVVAFLASPRSVAITGDAVVVGGGSVGAIHY